MKVQEKKGHDVEEEEDSCHEVSHKEKSSREFCMRRGCCRRTSPEETECKWLELAGYHGGLGVAALLFCLTIVDISLCLSYLGATQVRKKLPPFKFHPIEKTYIQL